MSISPFFGKEAEPSSDSGSRPLRKYSLVIDGGDDPDIVEAHYLRFEAHHVTFWRDRPEPNVQDTLILAITSNLLDELKEVTA